MLNKTETPESGKPNPEHPTPPEKKDAKAKPEPIERRKEKIDEDEAKPKKVRWLTRAMAEEFTRHDVLFTTFKEALLYIVFVIAVTICTIGRRTSSMFYITQALKGQFLDKEFTTANDVGINFNDIRSATDFWHYAESLMLDSFYWEHYYNPYDPVAPAPEDDKKILFENKLLGVPRIRQVRSNFPIDYPT
jgi:hypothetical protein